MPFHVGCLLWMGAYRDVPVVIKMGGIFMGCLLSMGAVGN